MNIYLETCDDLGSIKLHSWEHAKNKRLYALLHEHEAKFVKENIYIKPSKIKVEYILLLENGMLVLL